MFGGKNRKTIKMINYREQEGRGRGDKGRNKTSLDESFIK